MERPRRHISLSGVQAIAGQPFTTPRAAIQWAADLGAPGVVLDGTAPGLRARELDRSARRDLAAILRRGGLAFGGLDLWIPSAHFAEATNSDRAVTAATQAIDLVGDLARLSAGRPVLNLSLPPSLDAAVMGALSAAAERAGAIVADHAWPCRPPLPFIGIGLDPATLLSTGADVSQSVLGLPAAPQAARLSDLTAGGRVRAGAGRLDVTDYEFALQAKGYAHPLVIDLRGLADVESAARSLLNG